MKLKRALTVLLSIAIMISALPFSASASLVDESKGKGKLIMQLLKPTNDEATQFIIADKDTDLPTEVGKAFYVGIKLENFSNIQEVADFEMEGNTVSKYGLNGIGVGIAFNDNYVMLEDESCNDDIFGFDAAVVKQHLDSRMNFDDAINKKGSNPRYNYQTDSLVISAVPNSQTADYNKKYNQQTAITLQSDYVTANRNVPYSGGDDCYIAIVKFTITKAMTGVASGTRIVGFSSQPSLTSMSFGTSPKVTYQTGEGSTSGAAQRFEYVVEKDDSAVDFFPAGAPTLVKITKSGTINKSFTDDYVEGDKFRPENLKITPTLQSAETGDEFDDESLEPIGSDYKGLQFYAEDSADLLESNGDLKTGFDKTKEITKDTALSVTDHNDKHIYVTYTKGDVTKGVYLGQLKVASKTITDIDKYSAGTTIDTTKGADDSERTLYTKDVITDLLKGGNSAKEKLTVTLTYNNDDSKNVSYSQFADENLGLYKENADGKLVEVGAQDTFVEGTNILYVAETAKVSSDTPPAVADVSPKATITISNVVEDSIILKSAKPSASNLHYSPDATINFDGTKISYKMTSDAESAAEKEFTVGAQDAPALIFYIGNSSDPEQNKYVDTNTEYSTQINNKSSKYTGDYVDAYVFAVLSTAQNGATPIYVGQLSSRAVSTDEKDVSADNLYTVRGVPTAADTVYGTKLGENVEIDVKYDNGESGTLKFDADKGDYSPITGEGIKMNIYAKDAAPDANPIVEDATKDTILTVPMDGGELRFIADDGTVIGKVTLHVIPKVVAIKLSNHNKNIKKVYDGDDKLNPEDTKVADIGFYEDDFVTAEDKAAAAKLTASGLTFKYDDKKVGDDKTIKVSGTPAFAKGTGADDDDLALINANYSVELGNKWFKNDVVQETEVGAVTPSAAGEGDLAAAITAKPLTIKPIVLPADRAIEQDETTLEYTNGTLQLVGGENGNSNIVAGDNVTFTFTYTFTEEQAKNANVYDNVTLSNPAITGTDADNYSLTLDGASIPTTVTGEVVLKRLNNITIKTEPQKDNAKRYPSVYPETGLNLTGTEFNLEYEGAAQLRDMNLEKFFEDGGVVTFIDASNQEQTISKAAGNVEKATDGSLKLSVGKTTPVKFTFSGKDVTLNLEVQKKKISIDDIKYDFTKIYDGTSKAQKELAEDEVKKIIEEADVNGVKIKYEIEYNTTETGETDAKIVNITIEGDGSENYEFVDSAEAVIPADGTIQTGKEPTSDTASVDNKPAEIKKADQEKPADPTADKDKATNNITVTAPKSDEGIYEYAIKKASDGAPSDDDYQDGLTFDNLDKGTDYVVYARLKGDKNHNPSPASTLNITTLKYHVEVHKKNSDTIYKEGYTDSEKAASDADIHNIVGDGSKPTTRWQSYNTDKAATTKVEYDLDLTANNGETILYMKESTGGGGGGGVSAYTVLFNAGDNGTVTAGKARISVNSGASLDETEVPTVTAKAGYTFKGWSEDGTTIVDPTTLKITAPVTLTAVYEEAEAEATPTPRPTSAPDAVIDTSYTKPYAKGYEDGSFLPNNNLTRAELAAMIARISYKDDLPDGVYSASFPDVESDAWYNKYIGYLEGLNVLNGYEDGTFQPNNPVTRAEVATVLVRAQKFTLSAYDGRFTDVTDDNWAKNYIQTVAEVGIASGYGDGTFAPTAPITRAEAVTMINNLLDESTPVITFVPNDISGHWAEQGILLAVNERQLVNQPAEPVEETAEEAEEAAEDATEEENTEVTAAEDAEATDENAEEAESEADADAETTETTETTEDAEAAAE